MRLWHRILLFVVGNAGTIIGNVMVVGYTKDGRDL